MSNRLNEMMQVLTVITVIVSPLTLVAGIYGMNMKLPLVGDRDGSAAVLVDPRRHGRDGRVMLGFFKKRWL